MAVIRVEHNKENPYSIINKIGLNDERLYFKAKGILAYLLSKPDDWTCQVSEFQQHTVDGRDSIYNGLRELKKYGYLIKRPIKDSVNKITRWEEILYETPREEAVKIYVQQKQQQQKRKETFQKKKNLKSESGDMPHTGNTDNIINNNKPSNKLPNNELRNNNITTSKTDTLVESIKVDKSKNSKEILNYYKLKASVICIKPNDAVLAEEFEKENISLDIVKKGIDAAFQIFKPKYEGDKIRSLKFCEGFIRDLVADHKAKEKVLENRVVSEAEIKVIADMLKSKVSDAETSKIIICLSEVNLEDKDKLRYLNEKINVVDSYANGKSINYAGALIKALREDWKDNKYTKDTFNNYLQREYDFNNFKKKLLISQGFYD
ncbi:hypothetical protein [Clostridium felsineum]|uniref:hypothetical protein n=1 Tax=Clostridium felsineum TaxID=36839 RepID=UPI00098CB157|nr:hypothetical protein [Clostridium felsineum]URZ01258.1 hypothetical protein CLAUR_012470 [Clostridium felsineum]